MIFSIENGTLTGRDGNETVRIEGWGRDALRVRATKNAGFSGLDKGLEPAENGARAELTSTGASVENGRIRCVVSGSGWMEFFSGDKPILKEYYRDFRGANPHSPSLKLSGREFRGRGTDWEVTARFEARAGEKIIGMGQYSSPTWT